MKRHICLILFLGLLVAPGLLSQGKRIPVEPSETWQNNQHQPEKLMDAIGLKEGMTIADIGAGRGRMTVWFADRVGEKGKVYANDIDRGLLNISKRDAGKIISEMWKSSSGRSMIPCCRRARLILPL